MKKDKTIYIIIIFHICMSLFESTGPISTGVCKDLAMLIQITTYRYEKLLC